MAVALIMAGGRGERLWPMSRRNCPKQFARILDQTLFRMTVNRIVPLVGAEGVFVATLDEFRQEVIRELPDLPPDRLIIEPVGKNTAPCIGLAALHICQRNPDEVMLVLPSDHLIEKEDVLREALSYAIELAEQDHLVTLGIVPDTPHTGYGYIHRADRPSGTKGDLSSYQVREFTEKPDRDTALRYLHEGHSFWNSGMFCWKAKVVLNEIQKYMPELMEGLREIKKALNTSREQAITRQVFDRLENISIDYGVLENTAHSVVIPVDPGWNDLGSWLAMEHIFFRDESDNSLRGHHLPIETKGCLIDSNKTVIAFGIDDLVIVDQPDVLFIMPKSRSQDIKQVIRIMNNASDYKKYL